MNDELNAQIAQRLFGWRADLAAGLWLNSMRRWVPEWDIPLYTIDPTATAEVWRWVETQPQVGDLAFDLREKAPRVVCELNTAYGQLPYHRATGATWQEALCRAALFLAEALAAGEGEG